MAPAPRLPPANLRAEMSLLGTVLFDNRALSAVEEFLRPEHFADPVNGRLFEIIGQRVRGGGRVDGVTLKAMLEHANAFEEVGGAAYLAELLASMVGVVNADSYGRAILDCWVARQVIDACTLAVQGAYAPEVDGVGAVIEALEDDLLRIGRGAGDTTPNVAIGEAVAAAVTGARIAAERGGSLAGLSSGLRGPDRMLGGLLPGNVYIVAARPSMGKTALGLTIATRAAATGTRTLYWSGEMKAAQLGARAAAAHAHLSTKSVFAGRRFDLPEDANTGEAPPLDQWQWRDLDQATHAAGLLPLEIDERPGISVSQLRARARRMKRSKTGLGLIVADYLALLRGTEPARRLGRYAEVTEISADLLALARELDVPLVVLAQLNRANEARDDKRPTMADLRDSGAIEQDASVVLLLHRQHYYLTRQGELQRKPNETGEAFANRCSEHMTHMREQEGRAELIVAKNRHGPTGTVALRFCDETTWFRDDSEHDRSPAWGGTV